MTYKKIISYIDASNESEEDIKKLAIHYDNTGADEILICNYSSDEASKEMLLKLTRELTREVDIPIILGLYINRLEDVKKALYTGAHKVVFNRSFIKDITVIKEAADRFGKDKLIVELEYNEVFKNGLFSELRESVSLFLIKQAALTEPVKQLIGDLSLPVLICDSLSDHDIYELMSMESVTGVVTEYFACTRKTHGFAATDKDIMDAKIHLKRRGILVNTFESPVQFNEFKLNDNGLIPVIVKDYKTGKVLMLAYMNEESYNMTLSTGKMTYYSRSREELWVKGLTSGHFQYLKSIYIDCDKDTILANVKQIGSACHTGSPSCFYTNLVKKEYNETNPMTVFQDIYDVITDRRLNPKEGSYTNYLFEKGIDKILKKCGEEATEIVIAAKNPDGEELKYEIADFLYHIMVLMAECGLDWNDITTELAHRR